MFWDNFYHLCELRNTTPNAVCKELNLSTATATHWKNGTMPKGDVLFNLANLLDCSVDYLLGRTDNKNGYNNNTIVNNGNTTINDSGIQANVVNNQPQQIQFDSTTIQVAEVFQSLNFTDKAKVISLLAELSQKGV